nr:ACP phosphodiesterase [Vibrio tetraodonis]
MLLCYLSFYFVEADELSCPFAYRIVLPERFMVVTEAMWKGRWLESYQSMENIHFALQRMSTRSPRMVELVSCSDTLDQHYDRLKSIFHVLYPEILNASKRF